MARRPREVSKTGIYHVTVRGNAKGIIFETDSNRIKFIEILRRFRDELGYELLAYCLMSNHVHLIIDDRGTPLSDIMKKIEVTYVTAFNTEENRVGNLFQDRFRSKPIETDAQLLATVDYVHRNPERAHICSREDYRWSSYHEYVEKADLCKTDMVLSLAGGLTNFANLCARRDDAVTFEEKRRKRISDEEALNIIREEYGENGIVELQTAMVSTRNEMFAQLRRRGMSFVQIARLAKVGETTVRRAVSAVRADGS